MEEDRLSALSVECLGPPPPDAIAIGKPLRMRGGSIARRASIVNPVVSSKNTSVDFACKSRLHAFCNKPVCIIMVGLPARGKSYMVRMIERFLRWQGYQVKIVNVGNYRRQICTEDQSAKFFDSSNTEALRRRNEVANHAFQDALKFLTEGGVVVTKVAIFDATNTTRVRREELVRLAKDYEVDLIYVESICTDEEILKKNYEMKLSSPDYRRMTPEEARRDFQERVVNYERAYEPLDYDLDKEKSFIKIYDVGKRLGALNMHGYLKTELIRFFGNLNINERHIYLVRHGETVNDSTHLLGGDSDLTLKGYDFTKRILSFIRRVHEKNGGEIIVFGDSSRYIRQSLKPFSMERYIKIILSQQLAELGGGELSGYSRDYMQQNFFQEIKDRNADKLNYRYPGIGGESYFDVIERLKPIIMELEGNTQDILIISHTAVMRTILGYFRNLPLIEIPTIQIDYDVMYDLLPTPYAIEVTKVPLSDFAPAVLSEVSASPIPRLDTSDEEIYRIDVPQETKRSRFSPHSPMNETKGSGSL